MVLSDREIQAALKNKSIIIDPLPIPLRYNASAVDLTLGAELFRLRNLDELQADQPGGLKLSIEIGLSTLKIRDFLDKYSILIPKNKDGRWVLAVTNLRSE